MLVLRITILCLMVILLILGFETMSKFKKVENQKIEDVKKPLLIRIDIIIGLTVLISILTIINIIMSNK